MQFGAVVRAAWSSEFWKHFCPPCICLLCLMAMAKSRTPKIQDSKPLRSAHTRGLVPRLVPRIQTCLNSWDQSRGLVLQTMLGPFVCTARGTRPCDQMIIFHRIFYFFPVDLLCIGSLNRTIVFLSFCTSNIGHWRKNFIEIANDKHW